LPNAAYNRGATWERDLQAILEKKGWVSIRSAGSHKVIDVAAAKYKRDTAVSWRRLVIQCKTGKARMSGAEQRELVRLATVWDAMPILASRKGRKRTYHILYGPDYGRRGYKNEIPESWFD
jgi:Holliday junction resolvase